MLLPLTSSDLPPWPADEEDEEEDEEGRGGKPLETFLGKSVSDASLDDLDDVDSLP